jgi:hypothetical protein
MSLVINAPQVESKLRVEAAKRGVSAAEYAVKILSTHLEPQSATDASVPFYATATPEEWNARFDAWVDSHKSGRTLPESALTRESFYEGRY